MPFKAVLFDMGGVLVRYKDPCSYDRLMALAKADSDVARQMRDFDLGLLPAEDMVPLVRLVLPDFPQGKVEYSSLERLAKPNEDVFQAVRLLHERGLKVALVTNNGFWSRARERTMLPGDISDFDLVLESCKLGVRKPHSGIYRMAARRLGVCPTQCIFLDDSEANCEGARRLGMRTIHVREGDTRAAMAKLEQLLGGRLSLSNNINGGAKREGRPKKVCVRLSCEMQLLGGKGG